VLVGPQHPPDHPREYPRMGRCPYVLGFQAKLESGLGVNCAYDLILSIVRYERSDSTNSRNREDSKSQNNEN